LRKVASGNLVEPILNFRDRTNDRPRDGVSKDKSQHQATGGEGDNDRSRRVIGLLASVNTHHHVGFGPIDQLVCQTLELISQGPNLPKLHVPRFGYAPTTDQFDAIRHEPDEAIVIMLDPTEQFDFVLCHERQSIQVVSELVELAKRACQRLVVGRQKRGGNAVKLAYRVVLHLAVCFNFVLQFDQLFSALVDSTQNVKPNAAHRNQEYLNCKKRGQELDLHASRHPRNEADQRARHSH
jgi:hypothetical protein